MQDMRLELIPEDGSFVFKNGILQTSGRGIVYFGDYKLTADYIKIDKASANISLFGDVLLENENRTMRTLFIDYNYKKRTGQTGFIYGSVINTKESKSKEEGEHLIENSKKRNYYFSADYADLLVNKSKKTKIVLKSASFSDCDQIPPHHDIAASTVTFSSSEGVSMWNVRPRMMSVPYFYLPYMYKDLKYDWPWTHWEFGSRAEWGRFFKFKTNALSGPYKNKLKTGVDYRQLRGAVFNMNWDEVTDSLTSKVDIHFFNENWKNETKTVTFKENFFRSDVYLKKKINDQVHATLEHHILPFYNNYIWSGAGTTTLSPNKYSSPIAGQTQSRDPFLQEYFEEEYKQGRELENILALDYQGERSFFSLSRVEQINIERTSWINKEAELSGFYLTAPIGNSSFYYSNNFGASYLSEKQNRYLSVQDRNLLFPSQKRKRLDNSRVFLDQRVERLFNMGQYLTLTPYFGHRSAYYEKSLKTAFKGKRFYNVDTSNEIKTWDGYTRLSSGVLLSNFIKGYFSTQRTDFKHVIRPSIQLGYLSPSHFDRSLLLYWADDVDERVNAKVQVDYRIDNELYTKSALGNVRMVYSSSLLWKTFLEAEDRLTFFGTRLETPGDVEFFQEFLPTQQLRFSSELKYNTFYEQFPIVRMGFGYNRGHLDFQYDYTIEKHITLLPDPAHRHDFQVSWFNKPYDVSMSISVEEDPQLKQDQRQNLYQHGIRDFELSIGRLFHCLRGEINFEYDIESSGSTLIFKFGPQLFGDQQPKYRHALDNL